MHPNNKENKDSSVNLHFHESDRVKSFLLWPYDEKSSCSIKKVSFCFCCFFIYWILNFSRLLNNKMLESIEFHRK